MMSMLWLGIAASWSAQEGADEQLRWRWEDPQRFYLEAEVRLPYLMWFAKQFNEQARVNAFQIRMTMDCAPQVSGAKRSEILCDIDAVALKASGFEQERGLLQPILEEMVVRLEASQVQLQVRADGRLSNVDLEGLDRRNRRVGRMNENLRLVVSRAVAGLDLALPRRDDPQWVQTDAWLFRAPDATGTLGTAEIVHQRGAAGRDVAIVSAGRGVIAPNGTPNTYTARMESESVFDTRLGRLSDRTWTVVATPTPSSMIAEGYAGYPYLQMGRVIALEPGQKMDVGPTLELDPLDAPSAQQQWMTLGLVP